MNFSVIIPVHNEESFIEPGLKAIHEAEKPPGAEYEIIVVLNRCTDRTEEIARSHGARIVKEDAKVLSIIRNAGVREAQHEVIMTIDADSVMTGNMFMEVHRHLESGNYIGGGVHIELERSSFSLWVTYRLLNIYQFFSGVSAGLFWCYKKDFDAIGGFNEKVNVAEDVEFARRLIKYGKKQKKKFATITKAKIITSCRKFDVFGDWALILLFFNPIYIIRMLLGKTKKIEDKYFYEFDNKGSLKHKRKTNSEGDHMGPWGSV